MTNTNSTADFQFLMKTIANKAISSVENQESTIDDSKSLMQNSMESNNQAKMFLVAQAKNEMQRIVRLTQFLDVVEQKFMDTSTLLMNEYPDNLSIVQEVLDTIMKCINRSNDLIMAIVKDEKLNSFVFNKPEEYVYDYKDISLESKNKIREFATKMIDRLSSLENEKEVSDNDEQ